MKRLILASALFATLGYTTHASDNFLEGTENITSSNSTLYPLNLRDELIRTYGREEYDQMIEDYVKLIKNPEYQYILGAFLRDQENPKLNQYESYKIGFNFGFHK